MKSISFLIAAVLASPILSAPIGPGGPCPDEKVDAILNGKLDPSACCSYGICKGDVVISVGE
ncbi:hypothetical protein ACQRIT_003469 [Beauveria bassiana]|uniref:Uncharacterized protein n=2 Tax=Beauveria bassiana TaxID=176275 RepID=A0A2N6NF72_BEABA|nr:uncharacterized protein BBA_00337 [Beauveria bassiana ARSEF 2860]KAF1736666.1 hypothetical protein CRV24_002276 [Beauveria bassiana]EJP70707.1 hypothetical protein BBA_00337 [Beauveria bassiana ARSEF 2860]KAH8717634.1 hypothetical protein HC256_002316 [Beauveria bassiana]PMB65902.1 hypothetical protein BM221_008100 [Beauveria bassiana]PQK11095.1 hypothetical protein BB8028_0002g14130 [Beauveria bassiana]